MFTTNLFQFHKGTIRTALARLVTQKKQEFQFHKGTIRTQMHRKQ